MRALTATRVLYGSLLLLAPGKLLRQLPRRQTGRRTQAVARVLGARHLLQAVIVSRQSSKRRLRAGAVVDASHAATMVALAALVPQRRWPAGADALAAASLAAAGIIESRRPRDVR